jgi:hypothetical protein
MSRWAALTVQDGNVRNVSFEAALADHNTKSRLTSEKGQRSVHRMSGERGGAAAGRWRRPGPEPGPLPLHFHPGPDYGEAMPYPVRGGSAVLAAILLTGAALAGDTALLSDMHAAYLGLTGERGKAHLLLGELNSVRYDEKLAARAHGEGPAPARAEAARVKLVTAWHRLFQAVGGPQPIDPRGACRLEERTLREALAGAPGSAAAARVPAARAEAQGCLARLTTSLEEARTRRVALEATVADAKALLATPAEAGE